MSRRELVFDSTRQHLAVMTLARDLLV